MIGSTAAAVAISVRRYHGVPHEVLDGMKDRPPQVKSDGQQRLEILWDILLRLGNFEDSGPR